MPGNMRLRLDAVPSLLKGRRILARVDIGHGRVGEEALAHVAREAVARALDREVVVEAQTEVGEGSVGHAEVRPRPVAAEAHAGIKDGGGSEVGKVEDLVPVSV